MRKPIAFKISSLRGGEILYKCPACDTSFAGLGRKELYCHNCGEKIDWSGVRERVQTFLFGNRKSEEELCAKVNELNLNCDHEFNEVKNSQEEHEEELIATYDEPIEENDPKDEQEDTFKPYEHLELMVNDDGEKEASEPEEEPAEKEEEEKEDKASEADEAEIDPFALDDDLK